MSLARTRALLGLSIALSACTLRDYRIVEAGADAPASEVAADAADTRIDEASSDSFADTTPDAPADSPAPDGPDAPIDATTDAPLDGSIDATTDAPDATISADAQPDTPGDVTTPSDQPSIDVPDVGSMPDTLAPSDALDVMARDVVDVVDAVDVLEAGPSCTPPRTLCGAGCVDTTTDVMHCGRCGNACPGISNGAAACTSSACSLRCNDGFYLEGSSCERVPPPRPVWPPSGSVNTSQRPTLRWSLPPHTDGALVEFCATRDCTTVAQSVMATGTTVTVPTSLAPGVWFWRLRGRVGSSTGLGPSTAWELTTEPMRGSTRSSAWGHRLDFNGDGLPDVVTGAASGASLSYGLRVFMNRGGSVNDATPSSFSTSEVLRSVTAGDFNGDGISDVAAVFTGGARPVIRVFSGSTSQAAGAALPTPATVMFSSDDTLLEPRVVSVGDVDGDGYSDLVGYVYNGELLVRLWRGSSAGLQTTFTELDERTSSSRATVAGVGDVDGDGFSDFAISFISGGAALWYGGATPARGPLLDNPGSISTPCLLAPGGDVTGDGFPDILLANSQSPSTTGQGVVLVYAGSGTRPTVVPLRTTLEDPETMASSWTLGSAVQGLGDVNGDGNDDIATLSSNDVSSEQRLLVFSGQSAATLADVLLGTTSLSTDFAPTLVGPGSIDANTSPDIVIGSTGNASGLGSVNVLLAPFTGTTARPLPPPSMAVQYGPWVARAATTRRDAFGSRAAMKREGGRP